MRISNFKYFAIPLVAGFILPIIFTLSFNLVLDPFLLLNKEIRGNVLYYNNDYGEYSHVGKINTVDFDAVVIGASTAMNMMPSMVDNIFECKSINISTASGSISEFVSILNYAINAKPGNVRRVIFDISPYSLLQPFNAKERFPSYLYDGSFLNDSKAFLTLYMLKKSLIKFLVQRSFNRTEISYFYQKGFINDIETHNLYGYDYNNYMFAMPTDEKKIKHWYDYYKWDALPKFNKKDKSMILSDEIDKAYSKSLKNQDWRRNVQRNIDELLKIAKLDSNVEIVFFFTPFPLPRYLHYAFSDHSFGKLMFAMEKLVSELSKIDNVSVHGFDNDVFTNNLDHYYDTSHFHPVLGFYVLQEIAKKNHNLTVGNIKDYIDRLSNRMVNENVLVYYYDKNKKKRHGDEMLNSCDLFPDGYQGKYLTYLGNRKWEWVTPVNDNIQWQWDD